MDGRHIQGPDILPRRSDRLKPLEAGHAAVMALVHDNQADWAAKDAQETAQQPETFEDIVKSAVQHTELR